MFTILKNRLNDLDAPPLGWEQDEEERQRAAAIEGVRWIARAAWENDPRDHRTGCVTSILEAVAEVLVKERGWSVRQAAEAMVMEGVRAGGNLERRGVK